MPRKLISKQNISFYHILSLLAVITVSVTTWTLVSAQASRPHASFEAEGGTLAGGTAIVSDTSASGGQAVQFSQEATGSFVHPGVVYTQAEIDSWSTSSPEYTRLAATCAASLNPTGSCVARSTPVVFGTRIDGGGADFRNPENELNRGFRDQSGFAKTQAVLWAADNNAARRNRAIAYLQEYRSVTGFENDPVQQWRLVAGWSCTNLAQAAEIINYQDAEFKRFLRDVCYPVMDWPTGPNWHASFADSKLAIAAYLGDEELWADAKAYFYRRIKQSFYHSAYDGDTVNPIYSQDTVITDVYDSDGNLVTRTVPPRLPANPGSPHLNRTRQMWGSTWGPTQINDNYTINTSIGPAVDGMNAERKRDLAHVNLSFGGWINGARTIQAQGEQLEQHVYDRLLTGWSYHAGRVLAYAQTGTIPHPNTYSGDGGNMRFKGYYQARKFFGVETPASVLAMLQQPDVKNYGAAGALHMVAETFTDSQ